MPMSKEVLDKYLNQIFVETGTAQGYGVELALACGFGEIHTIELVPEIAEKARVKFKDKPEVHIYCGDSVDELPMVLAQLGGRSATFWLDAHINGRGGAFGKYGCPAPVELGMVLDYAGPKVIMIDDMRYFKGRGRRIWGRTGLGSLVGMIQERKGYTISFENGITANDVMVIRHAD